MEKRPGLGLLLLLIGATAIFSILSVVILARGVSVLL
jgi:hypothetical protein